MVAVMELFDFKYFDADREFIEAVGSACSMTTVWAEVREYFLSPNNRGWMRRKVNMRLSARRMILTAAHYLPSPAPGVRPFDPTA